MYRRSVGRVLVVIGLVAAGLMAAAPATAQSTITAVVRAKGQTGAEQLRVSTDTGQTLYETIAARDWTDHPVSVPVSASTIRVEFINDGLTGTGADKNLLVDRVVWDGGVVVQAETVLSKGVWNGVDCAEGYRNSEFLACNGWFQFEVPTGGGTGQTIGFAARGSTGAEIMEIEINGAVVQSFRLSTSLAVYRTSFDGPLEMVRLNFVNDRVDAAGDRNVYVEYLETPGGRFDPADVRSKGVWNGTDCAIGYRDSRLLACNGWFEFLFDTTGGGGNGDFSIELQGTTGTEEVEVYVNGRLWNGISVFPQRLEIGMPLPDGVIESIRVAFVNDGVDGQGRDRNVRLFRISALGVDYGPSDFFGRGVWDGSRCNVEAYHNSDFLACNGWFEVYPGDGDGGGGTAVIRGFNFYSCTLHTGPEIEGFADQIVSYNWDDNSTGEVDYLAYSRLTGPDEPGFVYSLGPDAEVVDLVTDTQTLERIEGVDIVGPADEVVTVELTGGCPEEWGWGDLASVIAFRGDGLVEVVWSPVILVADDATYEVTVIGEDGEIVAVSRTVGVADPELGLIGRTTFAEPVAGGRYTAVVETCADFDGDGCSTDEFLLLHQPYDFHVLGQAETTRAAPTAVAGLLGGPADLGRFAVTWDDTGTTPAESYEVVVEAERFAGDVVGWYSVDGASADTEVGVRPLPGNYRFAVRGCTADGCGTWSDWSDWVALPDFG